MTWGMVAVGAGTLGAGLLMSNASSKAAGSQSAATDRAIEADTAKYNQSRADLAPYREAGTAALTRLRSLLGITPEKTVTGYGDLAPVDPNNFDAQGYLRANQDVAASIYRDNPLQHYLDWGKNEGRQAYTPIYSNTTDVSPDSGALLRKFAQSDLESDPVYQNGLQFGLDEGTKAIERRAAAGGGYDSGATLKALTRFGNDYGSTKAGESYGRFRDFQDATYGKLAGVAGMGQGSTNVGVGANTAAGGNLASLYSGQGNASAAAEIARANALSGGINNATGYYYLNKLTGGGQRTAMPSTPDPSIVGGE